MTRKVNTDDLPSSLLMKTNKQQAPHQHSVNHVSFWLQCRYEIIARAIKNPESKSSKNHSHQAHISPFSWSRIICKWLRGKQIKESITSQHITLISIYLKPSGTNGGTALPTGWCIYLLYSQGLHLYPKQIKACHYFMKTVRYINNFTNRFKITTVLVSSSFMYLSFCGKNIGFCTSTYLLRIHSE